MNRTEAIKKIRQMSLPKETREILEALAPELKESEEDEKKIHFLSRLIEFQVKDGEYCFGEGSCAISKQEAIEMLKSLRPSWKPSVEQMNTLLSVEGILRSLQYSDKAKILASIYEQLKQLYL